MPPRKRMRWKQPAPSGSGQPPANSSRGSAGLESSDGLHLAAEPMCLRGVKEKPDDAIRFEKPYPPKIEFPIWEFVCKFNRVPKEIREDGESNKEENKLAQYIRRNKGKLHSETLALLKWCKALRSANKRLEESKQNLLRGLLRRVVGDEHWHLWLLEYMHNSIQFIQSF